MRAVHAPSPFPLISPPSTWPLTSVTYNKSYSDQSRLARKTFQTHQSRITLLLYPSLRRSRHPRARWENFQSQIHSLRRMGTPPDLIVIDFAKIWGPLTSQSSTIASTKTAGEKDTGNDGVHTSLIDNGFVVARFFLTATPVLIVPPGNRQGRLFCGRRRMGTFSP